MVRSINNPGRSIEISGFCSPAFAAVKDAFYKNFTARGEVGASVSVTVRGETVVDLWGGNTDAAQKEPWQKDTICCVQSVSKEITALAFHMAVDRGLIDVDELVTTYWPEFGQAGKEKTKVRWLLDHRCGIPIVAGATPGMAYDWTRMTEGLAATAPLWEPGTTPCYHSANYGFIIGEVLQRVTNRSVGEFLRKEIAEPLGIDCVIGLRDEEDARVATFLDKEDHISQAWIDEGTNIFAKSWKIFWDDEDFNSREWRRAEIPSVNAHTNARALARICGVLACGGAIDGVRLLSAAAVERAAEVQWTGKDVQDRLLSLSLGFLMPTENFPSTGPRTIGMMGAGGATAFADPDLHLGFGYSMNAMDPAQSGRQRPQALVAALNSCLGR
ncbi:CubicO group peptidase (beta-lactamase class C family) [Bosea sp. BE271]|uniref:Beta-lactamase-related domain-containing protein n=1 Tax=Bosea thiooxidans TaxID=53254 RepID=A0A0Q3L3S9_9HYPH|nr:MULTISPECIES: serine hydrolase domain-containing protein [Bosea]KQK31420.1 hypothetical protein ARD30_03175 [Bosea thiooxidans]MDR6830582.1 CubicO group peptidase (beta-lactamase class C family) [Bosea robiniae]MDR6897463.1 CubicO group peptidase (beta-lactamase class C family) [Bosea sp. BE109]MDR7140860.1 CubicO group peptidase (beta-lactamase class C family) [Bosea sp. BE168]MDR7177397.1 CubicO group peptidase (beta-lactamase class C family) [Bosea sp. BE271]